MIQIAENLVLKEIKASDCELLYDVMKEIYPLAYHHFWKDKGNWYVNFQYAKHNILQELKQEDSNYYFVIYKDEIIGNFRIIWDEKLQGLHFSKQVKLHCIYLHQKTHGLGIGKQLLSWLEQKAFENNYDVVWLDAMDEQPQAFQFYKKRGYKYHSHSFLPFELLYDNVRKMSQVYKVIR